METKHPRITLDMDIPEVVMALSEGNPGAATVCMMVMKEGRAIDPQAALRGLHVLCDFDEFGIYGPRIWMFYKDVCGQDLAKMLAVLRAHQLGQLAGATEQAINHAIDNRGDGLDLDAIMAAVMERLPKFNRQTTATA